MAEIVAFVENDMYVRNFLSSGAFDGLLERRAMRLSASEAVSEERLAPWRAACTRSFRREPANADAVYAFNKVSIRRYRRRSTTFDIKARTGVPFGAYGLRARIESLPGIYDGFVRPRFPHRLRDNASLEAVIAEERPKLAIFVVTGVESTGYELIKLSRRYDFRTLFLVNGWDNLSSKTVFGMLPDHLGLWGPQSLADAVAIQGLPAHRGFLLGCARYEPYFTGAHDPSPFDGPYAVFAGATTPYDELRPLKMLDEVVAREASDDFRIVYRPHPWRDRRDCDDLFDPGQFRRTILDPQVEEAYYANKRSGTESVSASQQPDLSYYPRLLNHASFVVSPMSSMTLEAALFNVPSIVLANDDGIHPIPASLISRFRHFDGARDVEGWHYVDRLDELPQTASRLVAVTRDDRPGHRSFAPLLARSMSRYLHVDERSYADRLLEAADVILKRVEDNRRGLRAVAR